MINQDLLRELFDYDAASGHLLWRFRDQKHFTAQNQYTTWNKRYSGNVAGRANERGYRTIAVFDKLYSAHRLVWLYVTGEEPQGQIDHINGDKDDNRISNLRCVSNAENCRNKSLSKRNSTGFTGVTPYFYNGRNLWVARIRVNGELKHLGYFDTPELAADARSQADIEYGFHPNHGRPSSKAKIRSRGFSQTRG